MKLLYFSGTGNSLFVARSLCDKNDNMLSIPQLLKRGQLDISDSDSVGFVFPTYNHNIPKIVLEYLNQSTIKSPYVFVVMTAGNGSAGAPGYFAEIARKHGLDVSYANEIIMPSNHIPMADIALEKNSDKNVERQLSTVKADINSRKKFIPSSGSALVRAIIKLVLKIHPEGCCNFTVSDKCVKCGICTKVCPRGNIRLIENRHYFGNNCESCQACVHNCPRKALQVKGDKNNQERYRHKDISLQDIIKSNNVG